METQNIEYKESWRDEYLKWICGFANAQGGTLYIGKNDKGEVVGVTDAKRLLEDIPNKVKNALGIVVDVQLLEQEGKPFLKIDVAPAAIPSISEENTTSVPGPPNKCFKVLLSPISYSNVQE